MIDQPPDMPSAAAHQSARTIHRKITQLRAELQSAVEALRDATDVYGGQPVTAADEAYRTYMKLSEKHMWWTRIETLRFSGTRPELNEDGMWIASAVAAGREALDFLLTGEADIPSNPDELDRMRERAEITSAKEFRADLREIVGADALTPSWPPTYPGRHLWPSTARNP